MKKTDAQARRYFDARLAQLYLIGEEPRPQRGWIRAIRDALGMSSTELAARMGAGQSTISELERSESRDTIKLGSLRRAADALDCDLVYFLVPRTTLDEAVLAQARFKAAQHLARDPARTRLADDVISREDTPGQLEELVAYFADRRGLWSESSDSDE